MASSSSSSVHNRSFPTHCKCRLCLARRVSWTERNPGRRFLVCPKPSVRKVTIICCFKVFIFKFALYILILFLLCSLSKTDVIAFFGLMMSWTLTGINTPCMICMWQWTMKKDQCLKKELTNMSWRFTRHKWRLNWKTHKQICASGGGWQISWCFC